MRTALHLFNSEVTGIIKRRIVFRFHESKFVQHGIAVAGFVQQELRAGIEGDQKVLVGIVTGLNELGQRVARFSYLVAAHRSGYVKDNSNRNRRIIVAKERYFLW